MTSFRLDDLYKELLEKITVSDRKRIKAGFKSTDSDLPQYQRDKFAYLISLLQPSLHSPNPSYQSLWCLSQSFNIVKTPCSIGYIVNMQ